MTYCKLHCDCVSWPLLKKSWLHPFFLFSHQTPDNAQAPKARPQRKGSMKAREWKGRVLRDKDEARWSQCDEWMYTNHITGCFQVIFYMGFSTGAAQVTPHTTACTLAVTTALLSMGFVLPLSCVGGAGCRWNFESSHVLFFQVHLARLVVIMRS